MVIQYSIRMTVCALVLPLMLLTGCGSGSNGGDSQELINWTGTFCGVGSSLRDDLSSTNDVLRVQLQQGLSPAEIKSSLAENMDELVAQGDKSIQRLDNEAGTPPVDDGTEIAKAVKSKYSNINQQLKDLRAKVQALPAADVNQFTAALKPISQQIADISRDLAGSLEELKQYSGYSDIKEASTKEGEYGTGNVEACKNLQEVRQ